MLYQHDWIRWLSERDAQVLLLTLVQAIDHPQTDLGTLRAMVDGWRHNARKALDTDNWRACIDQYLEVWVDARFVCCAEPAPRPEESPDADPHP